VNLLQKAWHGFKAGALTHMLFPAGGGGGWGGWGGSSDGWNSRGGWSGSGASILQGQRLDYRALVGDPSQSSVVMALCNWAGRNYPAAPLQAVRRLGDGREDKLPDDPCVALMDRPNPVYGGALMWAALIADCIMSGQGYLLKVRSARQRVVELWWVPSPLIKPVWPMDGSVWIDHYVYTPLTTPVRVEVADVIHLRPFGLDPANPRLGRAPLSALYAEVWTDQEAQAYTGSILRNLAVPGCVLSPKSTDATQRMTQDDAERAKIAFEQKFGGDNRGRVFIASNPMDVVPLSFNPQEMDLAALRRLPEERVAAVLGIPAVVAGLGAGYDHAIYSNVEQAREAAYEEFLIPIQRINAHDLAIQLLPDFTTDPRIRLQHDYSKVRALQEDQDALAKRAVAAFIGGLMMRGEARELIGLKARPEDNVHFMPRSSGLIAPDEVLVPGAPTAETLAQAMAGLPAPVPDATEPAVPPAEEPPLPAVGRARNGRKAQDAATISDADIADARAFWADDATLAPFLEATVAKNGNGKH
jgi:HK97 family phage portal protein